MAKYYEYIKIKNKAKTKANSLTEKKRGEGPGGMWHNFFFEIYHFHILHRILVRKKKEQPPLFAIVVVTGIFAHVRGQTPNRAGRTAPATF